MLKDGLQGAGSYWIPKCLNNLQVSIGGWQINIHSTIYSDAGVEEIIDGYNELHKLNLNGKSLFLPFFAADIWYFRANEISEDLLKEPFVVLFLRLCYWTYKCSRKRNLEKKKKEIRDKLKVSNKLINLLKRSGLHSKDAREWIRQGVAI